MLQGVTFKNYQKCSSHSVLGTELKKNSDRISISVASHYQGMSRGNPPIGINQHSYPGSSSRPEKTPDCQESTFMTSEGQPQTFNPQAYCELCNKVFCNKYFTKRHKAIQHGIKSPSILKIPIVQAPITNPNIPLTQEQLRQMRIIKARVFCEICCKKLCNKYYLKDHMLKKHGICSPDITPEEDGLGKPRLNPDIMGRMPPLINIHDMANTQNFDTICLQQMQDALGAVGLPPLDGD